LVFSSEKFNVQELVDQVADNFAMAEVKMLWFTVFCYINSKLFEVINQFAEGFSD
jgi:xylose isomerase